MKIKKLKLISPFIISAPIFFSISATENEESTPTVDPDFANFDNAVNELITSRLSESLDAKIEELKTEAKNLLASTNATSQTLVNAVYYLKVANFLKENKDKIIANPAQYGLNIVYPKVLSKNEDIYKRDITFDGITYEGVSVGTQDGTNYANLTATAPTNKNVNSINLEELKTKTNNYFDDMLGSFSDIFANEEDAPVLDVSDNPSRDKTTLDFNEATNSLSISLPENYNSWDDYIKSKINKRFTAFDLLENTKDSEEEEPEVPPVIPDEPIEDEFEKDDVIQNIPNLVPYINYEYYDEFESSKYDLFISELNTDPNTLNSRFFYNNPIFTRFNYRIVALNKTTDGNLEATVRIEDKNQISSYRVYNVNVGKLESKNFTKAREAQINFIENTMFKFYDALGIGEKITLIKLANNDLIRTVYNLVLEAQKIIEDQKFQAKLIEQAHQIENKLAVAQIENESDQNDLFNLFIGSLNNINLNFKTVTYGYFEYLAATYANLLIKYKNSLLENEELMSIIKRNFESLHFDIENYDKALRVLNSDISLTKGIINSSEIKLENKFTSFLQVIRQIQKTFINLSYLSINKQFSNEEIEKANTEEATKEILNFVNSYNEIAKLEPIGQKAKKQTIYIVLASILSTVALLLLALTGLLWTIKKLKEKLNKKQLIIFAGISVATLIISILLILLSLGGL